MVLQARFRVYGHVAPFQPADDAEPFDMAHVYAGGQVVYTSDQHFGAGSNLILPGRGAGDVCLRNHGLSDKSRGRQGYG